MGLQSKLLLIAATGVRDAGGRQAGREVAAVHAGGIFSNRLILAHSIVGRNANIFGQNPIKAWRDHFQIALLCLRVSPSDPD